MFVQIKILGKDEGYIPSSLGSRSIIVVVRQASIVVKP